MFKKVLVANRGEIACRVIRTARTMGIRTVAIYSEADAHALHVQLADEAICVGPAPSRESYLRADRIVEAALDSGAEAIHPGYGFLSENAAFAERCANKGLVFVGPPVGAITAMGSKSAAKQIMQAAGVPLVPGYHGNDQDPALLRSAADDIGYPVLLKAVAGGGGKGMRVVSGPNEFEEALLTAKRESLSSFGSDDMLVEKYLERPRHVEVQVFFDQHGEGVYLFERDCSVQRRHQKIIEEAPAPGLSDSLRRQLGEAAVKAAAAIDYVGAGTVEFLLDEDGTYYFMEMNTRLQVEHPVTEFITGQDLVEWQFRVATGESLPLTQAQLIVTGHAFEARVYAEDPENDFLPQTGLLELLEAPASSDHVRVDTGVQEGDAVSVHYDPMIAKLIVWDVDRGRALTRLANALAEYRIAGVITNVPFLRRLALHPAFEQAQLETGFLARHEHELKASASSDLAQMLPLLALYLTLREEAMLLARNTGPESPWSTLPGWRMNQAASWRHDILLGQETCVVHVTKTAAGEFAVSTGAGSVNVTGKLSHRSLTATVNGHTVAATCHFDGTNGSLFTAGECIRFAVAIPDLGLMDSAAAGSGFKAPMNGTVIEVSASAGDEVTAGQTLVVMEAMKMEHAVKAPVAGIVLEVFCRAGQLVDGGEQLLSFEAKQLTPADE